MAIARLRKSVRCSSGHPGGWFVNMPEARALSLPVPVQADGSEPAPLSGFSPFGGACFLRSVCSSLSVGLIHRLRAPEAGHELGRRRAAELKNKTCFHRWAKGKWGGGSAGPSTAGGKEGRRALQHQNEAIVHMLGGGEGKAGELSPKAGGSGTSFSCGGSPPALEAPGPQPGSLPWLWKGCPGPAKKPLSVGGDGPELGSA